MDILADIQRQIASLRTEEAKPARSLLLSRDVYDAVAGALPYDLPRTGRVLHYMDLDIMVSDALPPGTAIKITKPLNEHKSPPIA